MAKKESKTSRIRHEKDELKVLEKLEKGDKKVIKSLGGKKNAKRK